MPPNFPNTLREAAMDRTDRRSPHSSPTKSPREAAPELTRRNAIAAAAALGLVGRSMESIAANSRTRLVWGTHISLAPTWLDPAENGGVITPFMMLYAIHDALVKPMPHNPEQLCLAESYAPSEDGLIHEFVLRANATFHNGAPVTAEDVKFSF